jgi:hypothetical protein
MQLFPAISCNTQGLYILEKFDTENNYPQQCYPQNALIPCFAQTNEKVTIHFDTNYFEQGAFKIDVFVQRHDSAGNVISTSLLGCLEYSKTLFCKFKSEEKSGRKHDVLALYYRIYYMDQIYFMGQYMNKLRWVDFKGPYFRLFSKCVASVRPHPMESIFLVHNLVAATMNSLMNNRHSKKKEQKTGYSEKSTKDENSIKS